MELVWKGGTFYIFTYTSLDGQSSEVSTGTQGSILLHVHRQYKSTVTLLN